MVTDADPGLGYSTIRLPDYVTIGLPDAFAHATRRSIRLLRFCLAFRTSARLSGNRFEVYSSSSAFLVYVGRDFMSEGGMCQEGESGLGKFFMNSLK